MLNNVLAFSYGHKSNTKFEKSNRVKLGLGYSYYPSGMHDFFEEVFIQNMIRWIRSEVGNPGTFWPSFDSRSLPFSGFQSEKL